MIILNLSPQRRDERLTVAVYGETLVLNGTAIDLSGIPDGGTASGEDYGSPWMIGTITREDGTLRVPVILPVGPNAPPESAFPEPIAVTADGPVPLPPYDTET